MDWTEHDRKPSLASATVWPLVLLWMARRWILVVLALLCLIALSGCSAKPLPPQPAHVPRDLLTPCPSPVLQGSTYADFVVYSTEAGIALLACNARLSTIKTIVEAQNATEPEKPADR